LHTSLPVHTSNDYLVLFIIVAKYYTVGCVELLPHPVQEEYYTVSESVYVVSCSRRSEDFYYLIQQDNQELFN